MKRVTFLLALLLFVGTAYADTCETKLTGAAINPGQAQAICEATTTAVKVDVVPGTDGTYDLGTSSLEFQDLYIDGTANLDTAVIGTLTGTRTATVSVPAFNGAQGATATVGWVVTGADKGLATLAQSATADTLVIPISGLEVGDIVTAFKITGQLESAGNTATVDADLRKLTTAAGATADASIGAITQISKTADYKIADSKTLAAAETIASGETLYLLVTATTAASTDIELAGVELTVTRSM